MPESSDHAKLGPSSAHRWISCPASVRLAESMRAEGVEGNTEYAAEGTAAHTVAEIQASRAFGLLTEIQADAGLSAWRAQYDGKYDEAEMLKHADTYIEALRPFMARPYSVLRLEVKGQTGIDGVWGTADAVVTDPTELIVVDYKYGQGVRVDADDNDQLKCYALGAWESDLIGTATVVRLVVVQPRLDHVSEWTCTLDELLAWRESVLGPAAELALTDDAPFGPSQSACQFCPARGQCSAQMEWVARRDFGADPDLMTGDDFAEALEMLPAVRAWASAVEEKALTKVYSNGEPIPGWKTVLSGGKRIIPEPEKAIEVLVKAGYDRDKVVRPQKVELVTLGDLDKVVGKKKLPFILGDLLDETTGKPALVPESDNRPSVTALDSATNDFAEPLED